MSKNQRLYDQMAIIVGGKEDFPQLKEGLAALSMETANPGVL
ncbi:hypothetical protein [Constantimarinum furrinae]|nr:hypothetical protein [Constantimarinum furrinae]